MQLPNMFQHDNSTTWTWNKLIGALVKGCEIHADQEQKKEWKLHVDVYGIAAVMFFFYFTDLGHKVDGNQQYLGVPRYMDIVIYRNDIYWDGLSIVFVMHIVHQEVN